MDDSGSKRNGISVFYHPGLWLLIIGTNLFLAVATPLFHMTAGNYPRYRLVQESNPSGQLSSYREEDFGEWAKNDTTFLLSIWLPLFVGLSMGGLAAITTKRKLREYRAWVVEQFKEPVTYIPTRTELMYGLNLSCLFLLSLFLSVILDIFVFPTANGTMGASTASFGSLIILHKDMKSIYNEAKTGSSGDVPDLAPES